MKIRENLISSAKELRDLRVLTTCAVMAALAVALDFVASIQIGDYLKIGFSALPNQIVDWLFGPVTGALFGGVMDIVKFIIKPTGAFFPGYTLSAAVAGFIYGASYYKRKPGFVRIIVTKAIVTLVVNAGMNTLWISMMTGKAFTVLISTRFLKEIIDLPVQAVLFFLLVQLVEKTGVKKYTHSQE
jgi:ECF transporter S component (folate family)